MVPQQAHNLEYAGSNPAPATKPEWWNGRHRGLKSLGRKTCEFESHLGHHVHNSLMAFDKGE